MHIKTCLVFGVPPSRFDVVLQVKPMVPQTLLFIKVNKCSCSYMKEKQIPEGVATPTVISASLLCCIRPRTVTVLVSTCFRLGGPNWPTGCVLLPAHANCIWTAALNYPKYPQIEVSIIVHPSAIPVDFVFDCPENPNSLQQNAVQAMMIVYWFGYLCDKQCFRHHHPLTKPTHTQTI